MQLVDVAQVNSAVNWLGLSYFGGPEQAFVLAEQYGLVAKLCVTSPGGFDWLPVPPKQFRAHIKSNLQWHCLCGETIVWKKIPAMTVEFAMIELLNVPIGLTTLGRQKMESGSDLSIIWREDAILKINRFRDERFFDYWSPITKQQIMDAAEETQRFFEALKNIDTGAEN